MKEYLANKTTGFYISVIAAVLAAAGLAVYSSTPGSLSLVSGLIGIAIAVEIVLVAVSKVIGNKPFLNLASSICAVLLAGAIIKSLNPQLDAIGYVVSGLYTFDQIRSYVNFAVITSIAFVLFIIASFMTLGKQK